MSDDAITPDRLRLAGWDDLCRFPETCDCCTGGRSGLFRRPGSDVIVRRGTNRVDCYWLDCRLDSTKLAGMADVAARVLATKESK